MQRRVLADIPHVIVRADAQLANGIVVVEELVGVERYQIVEDVQVVDDSDEVPFLYMSDWMGWYLCTVDDGKCHGRDSRTSASGSGTGSCWECRRLDASSWGRSNLRISNGSENHFGSARCRTPAREEIG